MPASFAYHAPATLDEAVALASLGGARVLAGGQSLVPALRFRLAAPAVLVDLNHIPELSRLDETRDYLAIGALVRERELAESPLVALSYPLLHDTAQVIADELVRRRATIGGNLAHADPANDHPAAMLAYGAQLIARGPCGSRSIAIDDFAGGLAPGEILTEIRVPRPVRGAGGAYLKLQRRPGDHAIAAVAVQLAVAGGAIQSVRIGLTNVSASPMRARRAESLLIGEVPRDSVLTAAARAASLECEPVEDLRGTVAYKRELVRVLTTRAIRKAVERA